MEKKFMMQKHSLKNKKLFTSYTDLFAVFTVFVGQKLNVKKRGYCYAGVLTLCNNFKYE